VNIAGLNLSSLSTRAHSQPFTGSVAHSIGVKLLDVVNAFNAPQRRFGEDYDASAHAAVIKMMMVTFAQRPADLFAQVKRAGQGYKVTLRDGNTVQVSDLELRQTAAHSKFVGNDTAAISDANFALSVFVKRKQQSSPHTGAHQRFETVLSDSLRGETPFNLLKGLGMSDLLRKVPAQHVNANGGIGVMETHTFGACLVYNGVGHDYGRQRPIDRTHLYVLVKDQHAAVDAPAYTPKPSVRVATEVKPTLNVTAPVDLPERKNGAKPTDILSGFDAVERSFGEHFDVSHHAAVIKMMMMEFGRRPTDVFEKVTPSGDGYDITMKDGFEVHLSNAQLTRTAQASRFVGQDQSMVSSANFMLAAYIKRRQMISTSSDAPQSFEAALSQTLRWDTSYRILKGMGMIGFMRIVEPQKMQEKGAVAVVDDFSGALVLDGIKHRYGQQTPVVKEYGYRLDRQTSHPPASSLGSQRWTLSNMPVGAKPDNIWGGFYQGSELNCVTVSAIKAAMMKYGQNPQGIYSRITETAQGYTVTMRDSCTVHLTHDELKQARKGSNFHGENTGLLNDAIFLYAVSAKRAQVENHDFVAGKSFAAAMGSLNDKETSGEALRRLGLFAFTYNSSAQELASGVPGTLANHDHSVGVFDGVMDFYGLKMKLAGSDWMKDAHALKLV